MIKNKRGFTLIEILAVMIVLIIVILIAVNAIRKNVDNTLDNTIVANAGVYIKAADNFVSEQAINSPDYDEGVFQVSELNEKGLKLSGTKPDDGYVIVSETQVISGCLTYDDYSVYYASGKMTKPTSGECLFINKDYAYSGEEEIFIAPLDGLYKLEVWGAQGGFSQYNSNKNDGGYGGYSTGNIYLKKGQKIYVNVGGKGAGVNYAQSSGTVTFDDFTGYNGGGYAGVYSNNSSHGGGGGATHMSLSSGLLSSFKNNVQNILLVAGGGGGSSTHDAYQSYSGDGGYGGGYKAGSGVPSNNTCYHYGTGGSQTSVGGIQTCSNGGRSSRDEQVPPAPDFGKGSSYDSNKQGSTYAYGGGGAGFYGGQSGYHNGGGGGSGFIGNYRLNDKSMYCYNCPETDVFALKTVSTTCAEENPTKNCSKKGNGYAKITFLGTDEESSDVKYLYSAGNEFEDVTGGWLLQNVQGNGRSSKLNDSLYIWTATSGNSESDVYTKNSINFAGFTKLNVVYEITYAYTTGDYGPLTVKCGSKDVWFGHKGVGVYYDYIDVSTLTSEVVRFRDWDVNIKILQVWLSKD